MRSPLLGGAHVLHRCVAHPGSCRLRGGDLRAAPVHDALISGPLSQVWSPCLSRQFKGAMCTTSLDFVCAASLAAAQRADTSTHVWVKGLVAGRPVGGARIIVSGHDVTLRTGADGSFEIPYAVPFTAWLGFGGHGYRFVRYSVDQLPTPTPRRRGRIRSEIVLHPAAPDTLIVADLLGYEAAPDTSSPTRPDEATWRRAGATHRCSFDGASPTHHRVR